MAIQTNDILRVVARLKKAGQDDILNVFHLKVVDDNGGTHADLVDDIREYITDLYNLIKGEMSSGIVADSISIFNLTKNVLEGIEPFLTGISGGGGGDPLPNVDSPYGFARTSVARTRGGKFWPAVSEAHQSDSIISATANISYTAAVAAWIAQFVGSHAAATWLPGIVQTGGGFPPAFLAFTGGVLRALLGVQSRRKIGRGA